ncbi:MAG: hypothetical protein AB4080_12300 [Trichodesmium sp.]
MKKTTISPNAYSRENLPPFSQSFTECKITISPSAIVRKIPDTQPKPNKKIE